MITDLSEFLIARIAEDEAVANDVIGYDIDASLVTLAHTARWDPARVLAECDAKRAIAELVGGTLAELAWTASACSETTDPGDTEVGERILRLLALPYASHPDYRSEWTPMTRPAHRTATHDDEGTGR